MTEARCPECGKTLPENAPQGLCPDCLIKAALGTGALIGEATEQPGARSGLGFVPPSPEQLAAHFPELEIISLIGRGGMGAVYKARQTRLDRMVALKILPPGMEADPSFAERFTREAQALAKLHHPHIVTLFEFGQAKGLFFFLMEYVDGVNLRELMSSSRTSPREALAIVPQICDALQYAHDLGIVHRDIKPDNILLNQQGQVKIADFGVARIVGLAAVRAGAYADVIGLQATAESGRIVGTPQYMAPEQMATPAEADHRADIYSLGVVFYQMLTGQMPSAALQPPSRHVTIDVRLDEIVMRALERQPELRYQHASEIKTQVQMIAVAPSVGGPASESNAAPQSENVFSSPLSARVAKDFAAFVALFSVAFVVFMALLNGVGHFAFLGIPALSWLAYWMVGRGGGKETPHQPAALPQVSASSVWWPRAFRLVTITFLLPIIPILLSIVMPALARHQVAAGVFFAGITVLSLLAAGLGFSFRAAFRSFRTTKVDIANPWPRRVVLLFLGLSLLPVAGIVASIVLPAFACRAAPNITAPARPATVVPILKPASPGDNAAAVIDHSHSLLDAIPTSATTSSTETSP